MQKVHLRQYDSSLNNAGRKHHLNVTTGTKADSNSMIKYTLQHTHMQLFQQPFYIFMWIRRCSSKFSKEILKLPEGLFL